jgi:ATP phosphoribosyltransferase regulatory subunit
VTDTEAAALLPPGIADVLPPDAAFEAATLEHLMAFFAGFGYQRVKPPLIEFEETLLGGLGTAVTQDTFRLMDPASQRMLAVRADMTPQLARIATTRLGGRPRPLRLSYAGQIIRVAGSQARPERQFAQVGAELIGSERPEADAEVIVMAAAALKALGIPDISVDLAMPTLVPAFCAPLGLAAETQRALRLALDRKDAAAVKELAPALGRAAAETLAAMLTASGPAEETMAELNGLDLGPGGNAERDALAAVIAAIRAREPELVLTVDAVENRGFEYHSGVTCSFFSRAERGELGRGGRYLAGPKLDSGEPATGLTLFMDTIIKALPAPKAPKAAFLPLGGDGAFAARLRAEGWAVVSALEPVDDPVAKARRLGCTHLIDGDKIAEIPN